MGIQSVVVRRSAVAALFVVTALLATSPQVHAERPHVYAVKGARVVQAPGRVIEVGTVVIRDGLIAAVGANASIPPDAVIIDGEGLVVYPGLIDPSIDLGQPTEGPAAAAPPSGRSSRGGAAQSPRPGAVHPLPMVHPEKRASDQLQIFSGDDKKQVARYRDLGFTAGLVAPRSGIFRGSSAVILLLDDAPVSEMILAENVAQHLAFDRGRYGRGYPTSLMGTTATIRQVLLDAQRHAVWVERYEADPAGMERPDTSDSFQALAQLIAGNQPACFHADSTYDVLLAHKLAEEFELDAFIVGSGHEWEIADQIAATKRELILPIAFPKKPKVADDDEALDVTTRDLRRFLEAPSAAAALHAEGIIFALTTHGLTSLNDFKKNIGEMIEAGLPADVALAALTTIPARLLGIEKVAGSIDTGKVANLILTDGPIFAPETSTKRVFVDGRDYRPAEKKKPKGGDPDAEVEPRGEWSVIFEFPGRSVDRKWIIAGRGDHFSGTAETRSGTVTFEEVVLEGNMMTVVFPSEGGRPSTEVTVVITGDSFEGSFEAGPRPMHVTGTRVSGPEGGSR